VKRIHVEQRENPIVNRLNKTKVEKYPDLREEREARRAELRKRDQSALQAKVCAFPKSRYPALFYMYHVRMTPFSTSVFMIYPVICNPSDTLYPLPRLFCSTRTLSVRTRDCDSRLMIYSAKKRPV